MPAMAAMAVTPEMHQQHAAEQRNREHGRSRDDAGADQARGHHNGREGGQEPSRSSDRRVRSPGGCGTAAVGVGSLDEFDPRDLTDGFGESGTVHWMEHYSVASPAHRAIHYDRWPMGG